MGKVKKVDDDDERGTAEVNEEEPGGKEAAAKSTNQKVQRAKQSAQERWTKDHNLFRVVSRLEVDVERTSKLTPVVKGLPRRAGKVTGQAVRGNKAHGYYHVVSTDAGQKWAKKL